jgi:hypothetical protein
MPLDKLSRARFLYAGCGSPLSNLALRLTPNQRPILLTPDRELVEICVVWSLADALQLQTLLDWAGIPFFMGAGKATCVDSVTSNFAEGVSVQVMRVGLPWAWQPMLDYEPANEPPQAQEEEWREIPVRCPKCHSTEVIFERLILEPQTRREESTSKYEWTNGPAVCVVTTGRMKASSERHRNHIYCLAVRFA